VKAEQRTRRSECVGGVRAVDFPLGGWYWFCGRIGYNCRPGSGSTAVRGEELMMDF